MKFVGILKMLGGICFLVAGTTCTTLGGTFIGVGAANRNQVIDTYKTVEEYKEQQTKEEARLKILEQKYEEAQVLYDTGNIFEKEFEEIKNEYISSITKSENTFVEECIYSAKEPENQIYKTLLKNSDDYFLAGTLSLALGTIIYFFKGLAFMAEDFESVTGYYAVRKIKEGWQDLKSKKRDSKVKSFANNEIEENIIKES